MKRTTLFCLLPLGGLLLVAQPARVATPAPVQELRTQKVGEVTYFHVRLEMPKDMVQDVERPGRGFVPSTGPSLAPRLVGPADQVRVVCQRIDPNARAGGPGGVPPAPPAPVPGKEKELDKGKGVPQPRTPVEVQGLEFVGRVEAKGEVKMKLVYPVAGRRPRLIGRLVRTPPAPVWKEAEVLLDFGKARKVAIPAEAARRKEQEPPVRDDLEGLWAVAQVDQFADLDNDVRDFGFYSFAATAVARKYGVRGLAGRPGRMGARGGEGGRGPAFEVRELYETTTGAAAIAESLQLRRMNGVAPRANDKRMIPIAKLRGIDVAEHPWKKMMADKKPAPEAFARMVPHDNYYVHFKGIARFLDFSELLDQWGTNLTRAYDATSRDHRLKERYQQQLCLRSTQLGRTLGPLVIKGIAITGNDAYLREGSDVAVLFQVVSDKAFRGAVQPFLAEARKKFGAELQESKADYAGVKIESFVTPLREVSLHRATVGDVVIYANSPVGLRRVLDAHQGRIKRLADSLDFQYVRTIFRYDDKEEDGFAFLSDAFIRNLVGPGSKIKERRRLEALVSLHMLTHAALYTAWETGKPPASSPKLFEVSTLRAEEVPMAGGKPAWWDTAKQVARSDVYNTIHFATPLVEVPLVEATQTEADEYERFRLEYLGLWRQYFDPIGMRVSMKDDKVKLDTYILPLIENSRYNELRRITGEKSVKFDPGALGDKTLMQYVVRLSSNVRDRDSLLGLFGGRGRGEFDLMTLLASALDPVGDWFLLRVDDSPVYEKLVKLMERSNDGGDVDVDEVAKQIWSLPVAIGADVRNPLVFAGTLAALRTSVMASLPGAVTWGPMEKKYKEVSIVRVGATPAGRQLMGGAVGGARRDRKDGFLPAVYYATIDGGFYLTLNEGMMRSLIDGAQAKRDGKGTVEVATSLYLAPKAAEHVKGLLRRLLEQQTHQQARTALPIWHALYKAGVVAPDARPEQAQEAAYRYLGYVPVSPDGTAYRYDGKYDEVVNERHGSIRKPTPKTTTAEGSPMNFLFEQLRSVRADLRFREDGIHTVLTLERGAKKEK